MQRFIALATIIASGTFYSAAFAQNFDSTGSNSSGNAPAATPNPVMNTEQFKSAVDTFSKQTKSNLSQQVDQQTAYKPTAPGTTSPAYSPPSQTDSGSATPDKASQSDSTSTGTPQRAAPPASTVKPSTQGAAPSSQTYTGFGGGQPAQNSNTSGGNSQNKTNSNWNVGY